MPINRVIREKRKALGLTQEQVADYLGVSTPAVNKWESGSTCPDISLLPPLARLLKTDLNTLLCFHGELSQQELIRFCKEVNDTTQRHGIAAGFELAAEKLREYPSSDPLLHTLTCQLEGALILSPLSPVERTDYENTLHAWYQRLCESNEPVIRNSARFLLAGRYLRTGDTEQARALLASLPNRTDTPDKRMLQADLLLQQEQPGEAAKLMETALLTTVNDLQMILNKLIYAEMAAGETEIAAYAAEKVRQTAGVFDLWAYSAAAAPLQIAVAEQDTETALCLLREMLDSLLSGWRMQDSPLFHRMNAAPGTAPYAKLLPPLLADLETNPDYDFLRKSADFPAFLAEYRQKLEKTQPVSPS